MSVDELTVPTSAARGAAPPVGKHADRFVIFGITGDLAKVFAKQAGPTGEVWLTDINESMLRVGRDRLLNRGLLTPPCCVMQKNCRSRTTTSTASAWRSACAT